VGGMFVVAGHSGRGSIHMTVLSRVTLHWKTGCHTKGRSVFLFFFSYFFLQTVD
jgi:hypothetical protein